MRLALSIGTLLLASTIGARTASAQDVTGPGADGMPEQDMPEQDMPEQEPPPEYEELVIEAVREGQAGRWEEARALFRGAHEVYPNARTARGVGMAAYQVQDYPDAVRSFRAALADPRRPLTDAMRAEAERQLGHALGFVGRYSLEQVPEGASVIVDGTRAHGEEDGTLLLTIGPHTVRIQGEGQSWEGRWRVRGGEDTPLPIVFTVPEVEVDVPSVEPVGPLASPGQTVPVGGVALLVAGAAVLVAGVALLAAGLVDVSTVEGAGTGTHWDSLAGAYDRAPVLTGVGGAAIGIGAALVIGGAVWVGEDEATPAASASLRLGGQF